MLFIVRFTDKPESLALRNELLGAHLEWLEAHRASVLVAGSLRHAPGDAPVGGCWVVDAVSKEEVEALLRDDPFWTAGLREAWEVLHWSKAFPDRLTLV